MKKILLFLLLPLFSFSQDRQCAWSLNICFSYSVNDSTNHHTLFCMTALASPEEYWDSSGINIYENDSLTFYYNLSQRGLEYSPLDIDTFGSPIIIEALNLNSYFEDVSSNFCQTKTLNSIYTTNTDASKIELYSNEYKFLKFNINRVEDTRDRNVNVKLSSSSALNIPTKKGNQTLKMFSMNGQLVYSTSFNTDEWADVNISLPENIFPVGIYIMSLVSATEAQNFKVFVQ